MEKLECVKCKKEFSANIEDGYDESYILCPECYILPVVAEGDPIPLEVEDEVNGGKGEDDE